MSKAKIKDKEAIEAAHQKGALDAAMFNLASIVSSTSDNFQHRLWSVETQLAPLTFEVAFLYSVDGTELGRVKGTATQIRPSEEQQKLVYGGIITHNHPDGSFFSKYDLLLAHELDLTEIRAVRKGEPVQVLSLRRPTNGWVSRAEFENLLQKEENVNVEEVLDNDRKLAQLSDEELKEVVDAEWPAFFQRRLPELGFHYVILELQEPV